MRAQTVDAGSLGQVQGYLRIGGVQPRQVPVQPTSTTGNWHLLRRQTEHFLHAVGEVPSLLIATSLHEFQCHFKRVVRILPLGVLLHQIPDAPSTHGREAKDAGLVNGVLGFIGRDEPADVLTALILRAKSGRTRSSST